MFMGISFRVHFLVNPGKDNKFNHYPLTEQGFMQIIFFPNNMAVVVLAPW